MKAQAQAHTSPKMWLPFPVSDPCIPVRSLS